MNEMIRYNPELSIDLSRATSVLTQFVHLKCNTKIHIENSRSKSTEERQHDSENDILYKLSDKNYHSKHL